MISRIIQTEVNVICRSLRLRRITLIEIWIILDIIPVLSMRRAWSRLRSPTRSQVRSASAINRAGRLVIYHEWRSPKTNFLQPLLMENINTFQPHLRLANKSQGFRFQSATVLVNTSITKSLFIVLSKCLLLVQFCLAHVFTPWLCPETIPFGARKKGKKLSIVRRYISANAESPRFPLKQTRSRNWWWTRWRWPGQWRRTLSRRINGF